MTGAAKAVEFRPGPAQAIILGAITGIGGGMLRDVLLRQIPTVLRHDLYAVPAPARAAVVVGAHGAGSNSLAFPLVGFAVCFAMRLVGLRFNVQVPTAPGERSAKPAGPGGAPDKVTRRGDDRDTG